MDQEIETPAQIALSKVRSNEPLNTHDWECLLRFVALHDIRSPANYINSMNRWNSEMPTVIEEVLQSSVNRLEADENIGSIPTHKNYTDFGIIPMRVSKEIDNNSERGYLKAEVLLGRGLWLFSIRHTLSSTYKVLNKHTWSILLAPEGVEWLTSDNPVVKLNYYNAGSYDFKGGWGNEGTEIIFPLSPSLLLYAKVGERVTLNNISKELSTMLNRFIAENAHRYIFATNPTKETSEIRPRIVNSEDYENEKREWENWHTGQKNLEMEFQELKDARKCDQD
ncbi:hypothetical protein VK70_14500 [Paenibacillus durus ATCC 35681]|uniref:DUF4238 domain-containing protein n=2 Tax=Paenibacillus durus TaxID=44251 RepID=A0A0F7CIV4_PAEDU|nr:hypothetical protein VK70_14500 [Paenibacillus durus ATCC 35681]